MTEVTQEQLEACCAYWQECLRLQDWRFTLELKDRRDMSDQLAHINRSTDYKRARIQLARPEQFPEVEAEVTDWEHSLVHELLHVHLDLWKPEKGSAEQDAQEVAINLIAEALVSLRRQAAPDAAWWPRPEWAPRQFSSTVPINGQTNGQADLEPTRALVEQHRG